MNAQIFKEILAKYGAEYTDELRVKVMGLTAMDGYRILINDCNLPVSVEVFAEEVENYTLEKMTNVQLLPGKSGIQNSIFV
jgi:pseudouridine-5'-monophosphatase